MPSVQWGYFAGPPPEVVPKIKQGDVWRALAQGTWGEQWGAENGSCMGLEWTSGRPQWLCGQESACPSRTLWRCRFDPRVRKSPWRRKWQPAPGFLPGESHGQRSLVGYGPWGSEKSQTWLKHARTQNEQVTGNGPRWTESTGKLTVPGRKAQKRGNCECWGGVNRRRGEGKALQMGLSGFQSWDKHLQLSSVTQSCPTLCDPMNYSAPGLPVHHQLPESTQTHVHWVSDAIQPSHPLSSPSPPALNLSQHQGLFKWVSSSHQVAKVLEFQLQHQSFQWILRTDLLQDGLVGSPCSPRDSQRVFSNTHSSKASILRCSAFFTIQLSHPYMTTGKTIAEWGLTRTSESRDVRKWWGQKDVAPKGELGTRFQSHWGTSLWSSGYESTFQWGGQGPNPSWGAKIQNTKT